MTDKVSNEPNDPTDVELKWRRGESTPDNQFIDPTPQRTISSSIYPINNLRKRIQDKWDEAFVETGYKHYTKDANQEWQGRIDAYGIVLKMIDEVNR